MAKFTLENSATSQSASVEMVFALNPVGSNTWSLTGGNPATLPVPSGTWNSAGIQNVVVIRESSGKEILRLDPINVDVSLTDPFHSLNPGDSGAGIFVTGDIAGWILDSH